MAGEGAVGPQRPHGYSRSRFRAGAGLKSHRADRTRSGKGGGAGGGKDRRTAVGDPLAMRVSCCERGCGEGGTGGEHRRTVPALGGYRHVDRRPSRRSSDFADGASNTLGGLARGEFRGSGRDAWSNARSVWGRPEEATTEDAWSPMRGGTVRRRDLGAVGRWGEGDRRGLGQFRSRWVGLSGKPATGKRPAGGRAGGGGENSKKSPVAGPILRVES